MIYDSPQIMLLVLNLREHSINLEGIALAQVESTVGPVSSVAGFHTGPGI
jgi:hypothetical protein